VIWQRALPEYGSPSHLRLTLPKIGALVIRNMRRIRLLLSSGCPHQDLLCTAALRLDTS